MVKPVRDFRLCAGRDDIRHCAARHQPHHELDAFGSCLTHVFDVGVSARPMRIIDQPVV